MLLQKQSDLGLPFLSRPFWQASSLHGEILNKCPQHVFIIVARKIDIRIVRGLFLFFFFFFYLFF